VLALFAAACSLRNVACGVPGAKTDQQATSVLDPASSPQSAPDAPPKTFNIVFLGDSLTAGLGLLSEQAFPALIEKHFAEEGYTVEAINAGISGDTTAGGLRRVGQLLTPGVRVLVLGLGANDALRGLTVQQTHDNLADIIRAADSKGVSVVLCGMEAPTNYGEDYRSKFREVYIRLGLEFRRLQIMSIPFLLEGVAGIPSLNQQDGVHPNEKGSQIIADNLYPKLRAVVDSLGGGG
jgi:acyl-CoA thioesterase I